MAKKINATTEELVAELCARATAVPEFDEVPKDAKPMIVCSGSRWVHFGYGVHNKDGSITLHRAQCAIYWGTTKGVGELATDGPTSKTRRGAVADTTVYGVQCVYACTPKAAKGWEQ